MLAFIKKVLMAVIPEPLLRWRRNYSKKRAIPRYRTTSPSLLEGRILMVTHGLDKGKPYDRTPIELMLDIWDERGLPQTPSIVWAKNIIKEQKEGLPRFEEIDDPRPSADAGQFEALERIVMTRRSVREWHDKAVPTEYIEEAIRMAQWAPSACNRQSIKCLAVTKKDDIDFLGRIPSGARIYRDDHYVKFLADAPVLILVMSDLRQYDFIEVNYTPFLETGAFIQTLLLSLHARGIGTVWVNFGDREVTRKKRRALQRRFGIPSYCRAVGLVGAGYPSRIPKSPARRNLSDIVFRDEMTPD